MDEQNKHVTNYDRPVSKRSTKWKRLGLFLVIMLLIMAAVLLWFFIDSSKAVNDYRNEINEQYDKAAKGDQSVAVAKLRSVALGELINPQYKKVQQLEGDYQKLLKDIRNYNAVMEVHNAFVKQYNRGIQGDKVLNGDMLKAVTNYLNTVEARYPDEKSHIQALSDLLSKITESITFNDISSNINTVLHDNNQWLDELNAKIDAERKSFQDSINSI